MLNTRRHESDRAFVVLVDLLYTSLNTVCAIALSSGAVGALMALRTGDPWLWAFAAAATAIGLGRCVKIFAYDRRVRPYPRDAALLAKWERWYEAGSYVFSATLGLMVARAVSFDDAFGHMLGLGLVLCYTSGLAARTSVRPRITVVTGALLLAPFVVASLARLDAYYAAAAALVCVYYLSYVEFARFVYRTLRTSLDNRFAMERLTRTDPLTGLANRLALDERLSASGGEAAPASVLCIDLDRFKAVNDTMGHAAGDALLRQVAERVGALAGPRDLLARIGGDEFVLVRGEPGDPRPVGEAVVAALAEPFVLPGGRAEIGASVGVAARSDPDIDPRALLAQADAALYAAKAAGRNRVAGWPLDTARVAGARGGTRLRTADAA
jgi:diguanylate cyclase (GGDEF)-like protein